MRLYIRVTLAFVLVAVLATQSPALAVAQDSTPHSPVTVLLDGLPLGFPVSPFLEDGTTMVPLRTLSEALGFSVLWKDADSPIECSKGGTRILLSLGSSEVEVHEGGKSRAASLAQSAHLEGSTTVIPLRFFSETLGYKVDWDEPSKTADVISPKTDMQVWGFYALGSTTYSSWEDLFGQKYPFPLIPTPESPVVGMAGSFLGWFGVDTDSGAIQSSHASGFDKPEGWEAVLMRMRAAGGKPVAMFYADNLDGKLSALLADENTRDRLAVNMAAAVTADFDGAAVDFEGLGTTGDTKDADAENLTAFFKSLDRYLPNAEIYAVVPPLNSVYKGYDHERLGEIADYTVVMAYGYEDRTHPSGAAPWDRVDEALRLETGLVPKEKIILGVPAYGTLYETVNGITSLKSRPAASDVIGPEGSVQAWNPSSASQTVAWQSGDASYQAFLEDNETLRARVSLAKRHGVAGVAIWRLGLLQEGWWNSVLEAVEPAR